MKANPGKCHVVVSVNTQREIHFVNKSIVSSLKEKLLGTTLYSELKFEELDVLGWMFHSRTLHKQNKPDGNYKSKFDELLEKDGSFNIHHKNIQTSIIEIFKIFEWTIPTNYE